MYQWIGMFFFSYLYFIYFLDSKAALQIQRVWRGRHARKRAFLMRCRRALDIDANKALRSFRSVSKIQSVWRGYIYRLKRWRKLCFQMALRIQCGFRCHRARRRVKRTSELRAAGDIIAAILGAVYRRWQHRVSFSYRYRVSPSVIKIQCMFRRAAAKARVTQKRRDLRCTEEQSATTRISMTRVLSSCQLRLLFNSIQRTIGTKSLNNCGTDCYALGPCQGLFLTAVGPKARADVAALPSNRLDVKQLQKFLLRVDDVATEGRGALNQSRKTRRAKLLTEPPVLLSLNEAVETGLLWLPDSVRRLTPSDVDLVVTRCKSDTISGNTLTFEEFIRCLGELAAVYFGITLSTTSATASTAPATMASPAMSTSRGTTLAMQKSSSGSSNGAGVAASAKKRLQRFYSLAKLKSPESKTELAIALILKLIKGLKDDNKINKVNQWLEDEARVIVGKYAMMIQKLGRSYIKKKNQKAMRIKVRDAKKVMAHSSTVALCQSVIRRFICSMRVAHIAQGVLRRYVLPDQSSYWYNPRTTVTSWTRPRVLKGLECVTIPLPEKGLRNIVLCSNCAVAASACNCNMCDESFCRNCFDSLHCKGKRCEHTSDKIAFCMYCRDQMATKSCLTCSLSKPPRNSYLNYFIGDKGVYCDTCFEYAHDPLKRDSGGATKHSAVHHEIGSDAYLVKHYIAAPIMTSHAYENLVQPCEECLWRAAAWRCHDCDQVYCNKCLIGLHSIRGPFSKHSAEALPYLTPEMHKRFEKAATAQRLQRKIDAVAKMYAKRAAEERLQAVIRIQAWWRCKFYGIPGRKYMHSQLRVLRRQYNARRREQPKRETISYRFLDFIGCAPMLTSDTTEDIVLKHLPKLYRLRAKQYIDKNMEDWGYFREATHKKGTPHTGFDVGAVEELVDQAKRGGYRMPGRCFVKYAKSSFKTTVDLSQQLQVGDIIRIRRFLFRVRDVREDALVTDRRWRLMPDEEYNRGEVVYRMPCRMKEDLASYYAFQHILFDVVVGNPITNSYLQVHSAVFRKVAGLGKYMAVWSKSEGEMNDFRSWNKWAQKNEKRALWAESYLPMRERRAVAPRPVSTTPDGGGAAASGSGSVGGSIVSAFTGGSQGTKSEDPLVVDKSKPWRSSPEEIQKRMEEELQLPMDQQIARAEDWTTDMDPVSGNMYYLNKYTNEMTFIVPNTVKAKKTAEELAIANKKKFEEAQKRIDKLTKKKK